MGQSHEETGQGRGCRDAGEHLTRGPTPSPSGKDHVHAMARPAQPSEGLRKTACQQCTAAGLCTAHGTSCPRPSGKGRSSFLQNQSRRFRTARKCNPGPSSEQEADGPVTADIYTSFAQNGPRPDTSWRFQQGSRSSPPRCIRAWDLMAHSKA